jgi:hypothetical protein
MRRLLTVLSTLLALGVAGEKMAQANKIIITDTGVDQSNGATLSHNFGSYIVGGATSATTSQYGLKNSGAGARGYTVGTNGSATVSPIGLGSLSTNGQTAGLTVGIAFTNPGSYVGSVTVTSATGSPPDATDTINVSATVLDHANASFLMADTNALTIDLGTVIQSAPAQSSNFDLYNLVTTPGFTATLDLDSVSGSGDTAALTTNLAAFTGLVAGASPNSFTASLNASSVGAFLANYVIHLSDQDLPGAANQDLTLTLKGTVEDHANASFGTSDSNSLLIDFGTLLQNSPLASSAFNIYNLITTAGFTANLDLDSVSSSGDTSVLSTDLLAFSGLSAGAGPNGFTAYFDTSNVGTFLATYTIHLSDQNLPGAANQDLILTLKGAIEAPLLDPQAVPEPAALALLGSGALALVLARRRSRPHAA